MTSPAVLVGPRPVLADLVPGARTRDVLLVAGGAALVGLTAQIAVPLPGTPVPVTGQTFGVLVVGAALGWRRGGLALAVYALAGLLGVPWFSDGASGYPVATFGYILGFVGAAVVVGALARRGWDRTPWHLAAAMGLGTLVVFAAGVPWLAAATDLSAVEAYRQGAQPFLLGGVVKIALAAGLVPGTWALSRRSGWAALTLAVAAFVALSVLATLGVLGR